MFARRSKLILFIQRKKSASVICQGIIINKVSLSWLLAINNVFIHSWVTSLTQQAQCYDKTASSSYKSQLILLCERFMWYSFGAYCIASFYRVPATVLCILILLSYCLLVIYKLNHLWISHFNIPLLQYSFVCSYIFST